MKTLAPVDFKAVAAQGCFVYCYLRKRSHRPYYIGVATRAVRPFQPHGVVVPSDQWRIRVLRSGLSRAEALDWERKFIQRYGRTDLGTGILRNLTNGGDGGSGVVVTEATRKRMSQARKGVPKTPEHCQNISRAKKNPSPETRARHSRANSRTFSEAQKLAIAEALRQRHLDKLESLGLTPQEWAEAQRLKKAARRKELRLVRQAEHGRHQQSAEARENYRQAAIRREAAKRLARAEAI